MEQETFSNLAFSLNVDYLWLLFGAVFILFLLFSLMLLYHWSKYRMGDNSFTVAQIIYFSGSFIFILSALSALLLL